MNFCDYISDIVCSWLQTKCSEFSRKDWGLQKNTCCKEEYRSR